ncbi:MAG: cell division protein ZapD [Oceanococcus sp.]
MSNTEIIFEQPINERVRTMLRLEHLFSGLAHHREDSSEWGVRASIGMLIDILSVFSRNDLKTEISRELQEKYLALEPLREHTGVDTGLLDKTLKEIELARTQVQACSSQQISEALKNSEFLLAVINRSAIPGGTSHIDMPALHRWLNDPAQVCQRDLDHWLGHLEVFERAASLYLRMLRQSSSWQTVATEDGLYTHKTQDRYHLIRIALPASARAYPEISAGRQRFSVRFMQQSSARERETPRSQKFEFKLSLCSL